MEGGPRLPSAALAAHATPGLGSREERRQTDRDIWALTWPVILSMSLASAVGVIDIAIRKARTACLFNMNSGEIGKLSQPGQPAYGVEHSNGGLITFPGGVPLKRGEEIVGAVGVSGSSVENDHLVAEAGLAAMQ